MRSLFAIAVLLFALPALSDTLYITEFRGSPPDNVYYQAVKAPPVWEQTVAIGSSSAQSIGFHSGVGIIRIHCDVACHVVVGGTNPVATASNMRLVAGQTEYFVVTPTHKVAVIADPTP